MSRFVRVNDQQYRVKVDDYGTITLDTGTQIGTVIITGNLRVEGITTTVESTVVKITDPILTVNNQVNELGNPVGNGIQANAQYGYEAGFEIGRGTKESAEIVFNESMSWYDNQTISDKTGGFIFKTADTLLAGIRTNSITTGDKDIGLNLLGPSPSPAESGIGSAVVSVIGVSDYADRINRKLSVDQNLVAYESAIPNVEWVNGALSSYFNNNPPPFIQRDNSILRLFDATVSDTFGTRLELKLEGVVNAIFRPYEFTVQDLKISNGTIETVSEGNDLVLKSKGSGSVTIGDTLDSNNIGDNLKMILVTLDPEQTNGAVKLYTKNEAFGGTGVFFVNSQNKRDEFVSRAKAIAYSMIF